MRKAFYLMGILEDEDLAWLSRNGSTRFVPEGTVLEREGPPLQHILVVFVDSRPPSASVVAAQDSQVLVISRAILSSKLVSDNAFSSRFYRAIATLLAERLRKIVSHVGYGKPSRSVHLQFTC